MSVKLLKRNCFKIYTRLCGNVSFSKYCSIVSKLGTKSIEQHIYINERVGVSQIRFKPFITCALAVGHLNQMNLPGALLSQLAMFIATDNIHNAIYEPYDIIYLSVLAWLIVLKLTYLLTSLHSME